MFVLLVSKVAAIACSVEATPPRSAARACPALQQPAYQAGGATGRHEL